MCTGKPKISCGSLYWDILYCRGLKPNPGCLQHVPVFWKLYIYIFKNCIYFFKFLKSKNVNFKETFKQGSVTSLGALPCNLSRPLWNQRAGAVPSYGKETVTQVRSHTPNCQTQVWATVFPNATSSLSWLVDDLVPSDQGNQLST